MTYVLAQIYDVVCREAWAESASRNDPDFNVELESLKTNFDHLESAKVVYNKRRAQKGQGKGKPSTKGTCSVL